jgi:hypothetical protein
MTDPAGDAGVFAPGQPDEIAVSIRHGINRLNLATRAVRLAIAAADHAVAHQCGEEKPAEILEHWQASILLVSTAFRHLAFEVTSANAALQEMLALRQG